MSVETSLQGDELPVQNFLPVPFAAGVVTAVVVSGEEARCLKRLPIFWIEICVPAHRFEEVRPAFPDCAFYEVDKGELRLVPPGSSPDPATHQTWVLDPSAGRWRLDAFREPVEDGIWIFRRNPAIRRPFDEIVERTPDGIPYLAPEVVLLFKARHTLPKDMTDLASVLPALDDARRAWLASAIATAYPDHDWLDAVGEQRGKD